MSKTYVVGDTVWVVCCGQEAINEPCPVCFGEKKITLILGNQSTIEMPCDFCGKGYEGPRGYIEHYAFVARPELHKILSVQTVETEQGITREYRSNAGIGTTWVWREDQLFDTEEEAVVQCRIECEKLSEHAANHTEVLKHDKLKSFAWNAGYHMREAKRHREQAEYHERQAKACKERVPVKGAKE